MDRVRVEKVVAGMQVEVRVNPWLAKEKELPSRELIGTIAKVTERAILFDGTLLVRASRTCHRCGLVIKNPVSILAGYGPICSGYLGIPRDFTEDQLEAIRRKIECEHIVRGLWLARSKCKIFVAEGYTVGLRCADCDMAVPDVHGENVCLLCKNERVLGYEELVKRLSRRAAKAVA